MSTETGKIAGPSGARRWIAFIPVVIFVVLGAVFFVSLSNPDPSRLPSTLIGKPVPDVSYAALEGLNRAGVPVPGFSAADLATGDVTLVNVWGSWCGPCRIEHPYLMELAEKHNVRIFGINYKDVAENARRWLGTLGNPYAAVGVDRRGRKSIDWGIYGVPETFVVDGKGQIRYKYVGPIGRATLEKVILPIVEKLRSGQTATKN